MSLPPERRAELRGKWESLTPEQRTQLREQWRSRPDTSPEMRERAYRDGMRDRR
jgi:hypothetical protein